MLSSVDAFLAGEQTVDEHKRAIGVFPDAQAAEAALRELKAADFPMERVSVVAQDKNSNPEQLAASLRDRTGGNQAEEGLATGIVTGGTVGGLAGLLVGLSTLALPGIGPVLVWGTGATLTLTAGIGAAGAVLGGLVGAYTNSGVPEQRAKTYEDWIAEGGYIVMVEGTNKVIGQAESILLHQGIQDWNIYGSQPPNA